jgi:hypothetical protein
LTAILDWGFVGKQIRPSIIALLASVSLVLFAVFGGVAALPDGVSVSDEATQSDDDLTLLEPRPGYDPSGPASYNALSAFLPTRVPPDICASMIGCIVPNTPYPDAELEAAALKSDALVDSLSPGVRARYEGRLLDDEAEYAAFIEERLRRLSRK